MWQVYQALYGGGLPMLVELIHLPPSQPYHRIILERRYHPGSKTLGGGVGLKDNDETPAEAAR